MNPASVFLLTPTGKDEALTKSVLLTTGHSVIACKNLAELVQNYHDDVGAIVVAVEAFKGDWLNRFRDLLRAQSPWSDIPVIVVLHESGSSPEKIRSFFGEHGSINFLERPLSRFALVNAVDFALRSRMRQFEVRDLLEQRESARRQAEQENEQKDHFLAMLAHELRNPLASISSSLRVLSREDAQTDAKSRAGEIMKIQMIHISRLVDDLLDVARIRTGKFHLQNKHVDLYRVLSLAVDSILPMITEKRQNLLRDIPEGSAWVYGDSVRIEEALLNLLNNASKYTPEGGTIRVGLSLSPDEAVISIQDTGRGIEKEFQSAVFDPFFQASESLKSRHAGLGLGLFLVREIVKLHQGKISLRSEGKDRGSSFEVRLPLAPSPELEEPVDTGEKIGGHGIRILLIEDQFLIAESMRLILEAFGCVVEYAGSGERGILAFYKGNFDAVVIDIGLPDMSGYEVVQKLRAMNSDRNGIFVALSGYGQAEDQKKAADAGFDAHFTKPADEEKLLSFIQSRLHDLESAH